MQFNFRLMTIADYDAVMSLWRSCEGIGLTDSDAPHLLALFLARNPGLSLVAELDGRVVGAALCGHDGRRAALYHVAVDASARGQGIGRQIVERCIESLAPLGVGKCNVLVFADNPAGQSFWRHMGFAPREELLLMQRPLVATIRA